MKNEDGFQMSIQGKMRKLGVEVRQLNRDIRYLDKVLAQFPIGEKENPEVRALLVERRKKAAEATTKRAEITQLYEKLGKIKFQRQGKHHEKERIARKLRRR